MSGVLIDISPLKVSKPFRRVFVARVISLIGIGMLLVAVPIQMWDLTGSSAHVGAATAVTGVTTFVGMLVGGALADRFDRRLLILAGRSGAALSFAALAVNAFADHPSVIALYVIAGIDGLIGSLSTSALMAAVPTMIPRDKLVAVGALSSLSVRLGTAIAPGIAGFVIAAGGVGWAYALAAGLATLTVLILLGLPSLPPSAPVLDTETGNSPEPAAPQADAAPSTEPTSAEPTSFEPTSVEPTSAPPSLIGFLRGAPVVWGVMLVGVLAMLGTGVVALLPALVAERFSGDARATGLLFAAFAAGSMVAALTSGWLAAVRRPGLVLFAALVAAFTVQILFGLTPLAWLAIALLLGIGFLETIQEILRYALIQQHTPGPLLGRINGIWMAQEVGGVTVGALVAGLLGTIWVASDAIVYYGLIMLGLSVIAILGLGALRRVRRPEPPVSDIPASDIPASDPSDPIRSES